MGGGGELTLYSISEGSQDGRELAQGSNLEAGADAEAMEGAAYCLAQPAFL